MKNNLKIGSLDINFKKEKDSFYCSDATGLFKVLFVKTETGLAVVPGYNFQQTENYFQEPLEILPGLGIL